MHGHATGMRDLTNRINTISHLCHVHPHIAKRQQAQSRGFLGMKIDALATTEVHTKSRCVMYTSQCLRQHIMVDHCNESCNNGAVAEERYISLEFGATTSQTCGRQFTS